MSITNKIKGILATEGIRINELAVLLSKKKNKQILPNTLTKKINRGAMKYEDLEEILDVIGYDIVFKKRQKDT